MSKYDSACWCLIVRCIEYNSRSSLLVPSAVAVCFLSRGRGNVAFLAGSFANCTFPFFLPILSILVSNWHHPIHFYHRAKKSPSSNFTLRPLPICCSVAFFLLLFFFLSLFCCLLIYNLLYYIISFGQHTHNNKIIIIVYYYMDIPAAGGPGRSGYDATGEQFFKTMPGLEEV